VADYKLQDGPVVAKESAPMAEDVLMAEDVPMADDMADVGPMADDLANDGPMADNMANDGPVAERVADWVPMADDFTTASGIQMRTYDEKLIASAVQKESADDNDYKAVLKDTVYCGICLCYMPNIVV
jgi:hypothetical protein